MTDEDNTAAHQWPAGAAFKVVTGPPAVAPSWAHETIVTGIPSSWPGLTALGDGAEVLGCAGHASEGAVCHVLTFSQ